MSKEKKDDPNLEASNDTLGKMLYDHLGERELQEILLRQAEEKSDFKGIARSLLRAHLSITAQGDRINECNALTYEAINFISSTNQSLTELMLRVEEIARQFSELKKAVYENQKCVNLIFSTIGLKKKGGESTLMKG